MAKKNTTQKQKQKKAKQQQQQQQNVKINIRLGEKPARKKRLPGVKQQVKQPQQLPIQLPTPQYVPMFINQQPATYFTPPVSTTTLPVTPPTTTTSQIMMTPTIPNVIPTSQEVSPTPPSSTFNSFLDATGQMLENISDWTKRQTEFPTTFPSIVPRPPLKIQPPIPKGPTIKPIDANPPSIELDTFTNFAPRQNIISNLVAYRDLDEPITMSFTDYGSSFANVDDWVQESINNFNKSFDTRFTENETQTEQKMVKDFGTQYQQPSFTDFGIQTENIPSAISVTLREMETQTELPQPPPPRAQSPPPIPKDFSAPSQDIKESGIQQFISLTPESLSKLGGISDKKEYAESEAPTEITQASRMTGVTDRTTNIFGDVIKERAKKIETGRQQTIEETLSKKKEKDEEEKNRKDEERIKKMQEKNEASIKKTEQKRQEKIKKIEEEQRKSKGILAEIEEASKERESKKSEKMIGDVMNEMIGEVEKRNVGEDEEPELNFPKRKPIEEKKRLRKPGSGRPKGSGNKSDLEKQYEASIAEEKSKIKDYKRIIKELQNGDYVTDEEYDQAVDEINMYEELIQLSLGEIEQGKILIDEEKELRRLPTIEEDDDTDF
jgi:hypothetical protein